MCPWRFLSLPQECFCLGAGQHALEVVTGGCAHEGEFFPGDLPEIEPAGPRVCALTSQPLPGLHPQPRASNLLFPTFSPTWGCCCQGSQGGSSAKARSPLPGRTRAVSLFGRANLHFPSCFVQSSLHILDVNQFLCYIDTNNFSQDITYLKFVHRYFFS